VKIEDAALAIDGGGSACGSVAVQDLLSGPSQPCSFLGLPPGELVPEQKRYTTDSTGEAHYGFNSRRF
jgi:hypothetical protein